jgi:hypothetical protein|uniref:Scaffolding protein n=1 Tax=Siphoviridae sp. ct0eR1 TaxID=2825297 RepID=A0A8S5UH60_9CAUD|nr:MAG TPA: hypothetical protein [Siphoviridae sp. ct0eR1]
MRDNAASDTQADNSATNDDNAPKNEDNAAASKPEIDWKSESRKWKNRAKENGRAANERDELAKAIGDKDATIEALKAKVADFETDAKVREWSANAAAEHGISADLIRGTTEDEINAHAAAIAKALHDAKPSVAPVVPQAGATPDNHGGNLAEFARNVFAGD